MLRKKSTPISAESALLELSAREVQAMMQRLGVPSEGDTDQSDIADALRGLQLEALAVSPAPKFVPLQRDCVH